MIFRYLIFALTLSAYIMGLPSPAHAQDCGVPTTNGLVGYWMLDETSGTTAADSSGNGNIGTMENGMNATDDSVVGIINGALYWSDVDNHQLRVEASATIDDIFAGGGTIAGWIYPIDNSFGANTLAYKTTNSGTLPEGFDFQVRESNRDIQFRQAFSGGRQEFNSVNDVVTYNQWNHIAVVYDRDDVALLHKSREGFIL